MAKFRDRGAEHSHTLRKKSSNHSKCRYKVYFGRFYSVSYLLETYLARKLSSDRHRASGDLLTIILSLFSIITDFFSFLFRKGLFVEYYVQFKVLCPVLIFSRSDCHTPGNYLRSHLGLRSTKMLL